MRRGLTLAERGRLLAERVHLLAERVRLLAELSGVRFRRGRLLAERLGLRVHHLRSPHEVLPRPARAVGMDRGHGLSIAAEGVGGGGLRRRLRA